MLSRVRHPVHAVLNARSGKWSALPEKHRVVDPGVALVPGLEPKAGEEVLIPEVDRHVLAVVEGDECRGDLDESSILEVDVSIVDSPHRGSHIDTEIAVRPDEAPVGASSHEGAPEALTRDFATGYRGNGALPEWSRPDHDHVNVGVEAELLDELRCRCVVRHGPALQRQPIPEF